MTARALALAALLASGSPPTAYAQSEPTHGQTSRVRTSWLAELGPHAAEPAHDRAQALESQLEARISQHCRCTGARVRIDLPSAAFHPLDAPLPAPQVRVSLPAGGSSRLSDDAVRTLVSRSSAELSNAAVEVSRTQSPISGAAPERLVRVGPLRVSETSAPALRAVLAGSLLANVMLATLVLARSRRGRRNSRVY